MLEKLKPIFLSALSFFIFSSAHAYQDMCPNYKDIAKGNFNGWSLEISTDSTNHKSIRGGNFKFKWAFWDEKEANCVYSLNFGEFVLTKKGLPQPTSANWGKWIGAYWCGGSENSDPSQCYWE